MNQKRMDELKSENEQLRQSNKELEHENRLLEHELCYLELLRDVLDSDIAELDKAINSFHDMLRELKKNSTTESK